MLSYIVISGGFGALIFWIVGLVLVWAILRYVFTRIPNVPPIGATVVDVLFALILLLFVVDFFFGH